MQKPATETTDSIFIAMDFVHKAHYGQYRKGTKIPYFVHPLGVAKILIEYECSEEIIIAGLLHDTLEDTAITIEEIEKNFGKTVARIVSNITEPEKSVHWEKRKQSQFDLIKNAPLEELYIICADKLDNLKSIKEDYEKIGDKIWSRFSRSYEKQKWFYQSVARELVKRINGEPSNTLFRKFEREVQLFFGKE